MRPSRRVGLPSLLLALGASWAPALGGDSPAEAALKDKGLVKAGRLFVDPEAERPVLARLTEVSATFAAYASAAEKQAAADSIPAQLAQLEDQRLSLRANLDSLNQQINAQNASMGNGRYARAARAMGPSPLQAQQQQVTAALNEVAAAAKSVKAQGPSPKDKEAIDLEAKKKGDDFKLALAELRPMVDAVLKKYADLNADEAVRKPLLELEKAAHAKITIGPSAALAAGIKELDQAERQFLGKRPAAAPKKKAQAKPKK